MLSIYDFKDALIHLFQTDSSYQPHSLHNLSKKRIAIDCRSLINYMFNTSSCQNVHQSVAFFASQVKSLDIRPFVILNGIDVLDSDHFSGPAKALSNFIENHYFYKLMLTNFLESTLISNSSINSISVYGDVIKDSLACSIFQRAFEEQLVVAFRETGIDYIKSPQSRESQFNYLFRARRADVLMTSPLAFMICDVETLVGEINFTDEVYMRYDLKAFAARYGLEVHNMRKCIFASLMYFKCHPSICHKSKLESAVAQHALQFSSSLEATNRQNAAIICEIIKTLAPTVHRFQINLDFCMYLASLWSLSVNDVLKHANLLFNSPVISIDNRVLNTDNQDFPFSGENLIDVSLNSLTLWFCKCYFDHDFFSLFNKCTKYTFFVCYPNIEILEARFLYKVYLKEKLEECIGYVLGTIAYDFKAEFKLSLFDEESIRLTPKKKRRDFFLLPTLKHKKFPPGSIYEALLAFGDALHKGVKFVPWKFLSDCRVEDVLVMLNLNFLHDLGYVDLDKRTMKLCGNALLHIGGQKFAEEVIIAYECIRCLLIHKQDYELFPDVSERLRREILDDFRSFDKGCDKQKSQTNTNAGSRQIEGMAKSKDVSLKMDTAQSSLFSLLIKNSPTGLQNLKIESLVSTPYNVIKNFQVEYIKFYKLQVVNRRIEEVLSRAFRDSGLQRVLFLGRVLFFVPSKSTLQEIFDADFNHLRHLFLVIRKSLQRLLKSSFRMFAFLAAKEHDVEFIESVLSRLPFQKQRSGHLSSLMKILLQKYLIYKSLEELKDPFATVYRQKLDIRKVKAKMHTDFDLKQYLSSAVSFYQTIWTFCDKLKSDSPRAHANDVSAMLADSWGTFDSFVKFFSEEG